MNKLAALSLALAVTNRALAEPTPQPMPPSVATTSSAPTTGTVQQGSRPGEELTNGLGMKFCWIPPGTFEMGSPDGQPEAKQGELPAHQVRLSRGFWMGSTEVTQAEWEAVMGSNPSSEKGPRRPVGDVSWDFAREFCRRLGERDGRSYRLPTEAEWERACRAGSPEPRYGKLDAVAWYDKNSGGRSHDVGQASPNAWGLYDMLGNVSEWCEDVYQAYHEGSLTDPHGPDGGKYRVTRGGNWDYYAPGCRAAFRYETVRCSTSSSRGFRVVLELPGDPAAAAAARAKAATDELAAAAGDHPPMSNGIGMKLVWIPPGTFRMGSPDDDPEHRDDEGPVHPVTLSRGFWMGSTEVTQAEWEAVMGDKPSGFAGGPRRPVEKVSWDDCQEFCRKLGQREGRPYRLPREAEWEYACRAGSSAARYGDLAGVAWYDGNGGNETHEVGQRTPNAWGLHDMLGNVREWVEDAFGPYGMEAETDPRGANGEDHLQRGGSWDDGEGRCRAAYRLYASADSRDSSLGFRVVLGP